MSSGEKPILGGETPFETLFGSELPFGTDELSAEAPLPAKKRIERDDSEGVPVGLPPLDGSPWDGPEVEPEPPSEAVIALRAEIEALEAELVRLRAERPASPAVPVAVASVVGLGVGLGIGLLVG